MTRRSASVLLLALSTTVGTACAPGVPTLTPAHPDLRAGIPHQPDLVTVIPFDYAAPRSLDGYRAVGYILIAAEIDGHRGTFLLDTGAGGFWLNPKYLQASRTGGLDTVRTHQVGAPRFCSRPRNSSQHLCHVTVQQLQIGTLRQTLTGPDPAPTTPNVWTNGRIADSSEHRFDELFGRPVLGWIGPSALHGVETIIDYPHQRVILIRLDSAGRRRVAVPALTPVTEVPLIHNVGGRGADAGFEYYSLAVKMRDKVDTLILDTGNLTNNWSDFLDDDYDHYSQDSAFTMDGGRLIAHRMMVGSDTMKSVPFQLIPMGMRMLGTPFLSEIGVVGFNFQTRRLLMYK